jgi:hypothetical protein
MDKVTFIEVEGLEHAVIENADGSFTTMLKTEYDRRQAEQSTPIVVNEAETI